MTGSERGGQGKAARAGKIPGIFSVRPSRHRGGRRKDWQCLPAGWGRLVRVRTVGGSGVVAEGENT